VLLALLVVVDVVPPEALDADLVEKKEDPTLDTRLHEPVALFTSVNVFPVQVAMTTGIWSFPSAMTFSIAALASA